MIIHKKVIGGMLYTASLSVKPVGRSAAKMRRDERDRRIIELYTAPVQNKKATSSKAIAKIVNCSTTTVKRVISEEAKKRGISALEMKGGKWKQQSPVKAISQLSQSKNKVDTKKLSSL